MAHPPADELGLPLLFSLA